MDRLETFIRVTAEAVEERLAELMPRSERRPGTLHEAMRYSVLDGGKRIRPAMTLATYAAAGGNDGGRSAALDAACAVELMHCYSLVHDDLPAMDNDAMRRNRLTTHKAFGEDVAILVGDALQALAFQVAGECAGAKAGRIVGELARASGSVGLVGGQMLDLEGEGRPQIPEEIERIDRWKTGALITCACRLGGILADAPADRLDSITKYGDAIGVMYQISDDLLDLVGNTKRLGKTIGKDKAAGKLTYPAALGVEAARYLASEKSDAAQHVIRNFGREALYLRLLAGFLLDRTA